MQVNYPSTVKNLGQNRVEKPDYKESPHPHVSTNHDKDATKYKEFVTILQSNIDREHDLNQKKRAHNRVSATKSVAYEVYSSILLNYMF